MGRKRIGGHLFVWWRGDHPPPHVHVYDGKGRFLGRLRTDTLEPIGDWKPSAKIIELVRQLREEREL